MTSTSTRLTSFTIIATRLFESITDTIAWTVVVWSTKMTFQVGWWCGVLRGTAEVSYTYSVIRGGSSSGRCNGKKETRELHVFDMDSSRGMCAVEWCVGGGQIDFMMLATLFCGIMGFGLLIAVEKAVSRGICLLTHQIQAQRRGPASTWPTRRTSDHPHIMDFETDVLICLEGSRKMWVQETCILY